MAVAVQELTNTVVDFLDEYGVAHLVGLEFCHIIGIGSGRSRFGRLLEACGHKDEARPFFQELLPQLAVANHLQESKIKVGSVKIPYQLLLAIMEVLLPGNRIHDIKTVHQYEKLTNTKVAKEDKEKISKVLHDYPVRLTMHTIRQMRLSPAVAYQYAPDLDELHPEGQSHTWVGQFHRGVLEQMYRNRLIFVLNMKCPVYCRFCFRKHKECRNQKSPTQSHVKQALAYIKEAPDVKEIVLTGGDPFMNKSTLSLAIDGLRNIPHIKTLRLATRSLSYYPHLFRADNGSWLRFLKRKSLELSEKNKRLEIATHFIHPTEISVDGLDCIAELVSTGIPVYVQTPFLGNCNDKGPELVELYTLLRSVGAEIHYIFIPCSPILGNHRYWRPISEGLRVGQHLRAHLSDRATPHITTATAIGKIDWQTSGWAVEPDKNDSRFIWIRTPYTMEYFQNFAPLLQLNETVRDNKEGTLDCRFQTEIGDEKLFGGERTVFVTKKEKLPFEERNTHRERLEQLKHLALADQRAKFSIIPTNITGCWRQHETRVEIDCEVDKEKHAEIIEYISKDERISEVNVTGSRDTTHNLFDTIQLLEALTVIPHVRAIRLRSLKFNYNPKRFTPTIIRKLARHNQLDPATAVRLEICTSFLHESEFTKEHEEVANQLRERGITVFNETPLLAGINDRPEDILAIANECRHAGIEFHALFLTGMAIQNSWPQSQAIELARVIDIASHVRLNGSGREIPAYILRTAVGDIDYGLSTEFVKTDEDDRAVLKLLSCHLSDLLKLDENYKLPDEAKVNEDGTISLPIDGVHQTTEIEQPV